MNAADRRDATRITPWRELVDECRSLNQTARLLRGSDGRMRAMAADTGRPLGVLVTEAEVDEMEDGRRIVDRDGLRWMRVGCAAFTAFVLFAVCVEAAYHVGLARGRNVESTTR